MCYIKNKLELSQRNRSLFQTKNGFFNCQSFFAQEDNINIIQIEQKETDSFTLKQKQNQQKKSQPYNTLLLANSIISILKNSEYIQFSNKSIQDCSSKLIQIFKQFQQLQVYKQASKINFKKQQTIHHIQHNHLISKDYYKEQISDNALVRSVFGQKKYRFKLVLVQKFPNIIYKERNINIKVKLVNLDQKQIKNTNLINLCLGILSDKGQWIVKNRVKDPMLKGKTQIQLYYGEAQFNKIYPKDITKTFFNGRINFIVYPKPSVLIYNEAKSDEDHIDYQLIEPLLISDVIIKAKKKN